MQTKKTDIPTAKPRNRAIKRPMTSEKKAAAVKPRAAKKTKAGSPAPEVFVQFQGGEISIAALADAAKEDFRQVKDRAPITDIKLYVKPEEYTAYYVINMNHEGKVTF